MAPEIHAVTTAPPSPVSPGSSGSSRVSRIFEEARKLAPGQRTSFLTRECGTDASMRTEVESLLHHYDEARRENLLKSPEDMKRRTIAGRYKVLGELGRGGMGVVLKVYDEQMGRVMALKRVRHVDNESRRRFKTEIDAIKLLNHENICATYEDGSDQEGPFLVMELIEGGTLHDRLKDGPLTDDEFVAIARGLSLAIQCAHQYQVIHRDITPRNVLLTTQGVPKLTDFGLARIGVSKHSMPGGQLGTAAYASPEQLRDGSSATHQSDIYGLGATLYHAISGRVPDKPDPSCVPARWRPLIQKCMAHLPEDRFFSAREIVDALDPDGGQKLEASPASPGAGVLCPECDTPNRSQARFCFACGVGFFKLCANCGVEEAVDAEHCSGCGKSFRLRSESDRLLNVARGLVAQRRLWEAIHTLDKAHKVDPDHEEVNELLRTVRTRYRPFEELIDAAIGLETIEKHREARSHWITIRQHDPKNPEARSALTRLQRKILLRDLEKGLRQAMRSRDYVAARRYVRRLKRVAPDSKLLSVAEGAFRQFRENMVNRAQSHFERHLPRRGWSECEKAIRQLKICEAATAAVAAESRLTRARHLFWRRSRINRGLVAGGVVLSVAACAAIFLYGEQMLWSVAGPLLRSEQPGPAVAAAADAMPPPAETDDTRTPNATQAMPDPTAGDDSRPKVLLTRATVLTAIDRGELERAERELSQVEEPGSLARLIELLRAGPATLSTPGLRELETLVLGEDRYLLVQTALKVEAEVRKRLVACLPQERYVIDGSRHLPVGAAHPVRRVRIDDAWLDPVNDTPPVFSLGPRPDGVHTATVILEDPYGVQMAMSINLDLHHQLDLEGEMVAEPGDARTAVIPFTTVASGRRLELALEEPPGIATLRSVDGERRWQVEVRLPDDKPRLSSFMFQVRDEYDNRTGIENPPVDLHDARVPRVAALVQKKQWQQALELLVAIPGFMDDTELSSYLLTALTGRLDELTPLEPGTAWENGDAVATVLDSIEAFTEAAGRDLGVELLEVLGRAQRLCEDRIYKVAAVRS